MPAARLKGVGHPTTPAPETSQENLAVAEAVATALDSLEILERHSQEVADAFRWNRVAEARRGLTELVQSTQTLLKLAVMTAQATGTDLDTLIGPDGLRADEDTHAAIDEMIEHQLAEDWVALADTLDQAFASALAHWRLVFETLGGDDPDGNPPKQAA